jgi:hypothetical protein
MAEETPFASLPGSAPIRINDMLYNILDDITGEYITYSKITNYPAPSGGAMTDAQCDGVLYRKAPTGEYFKRNFNGGVNVQWFGAKGDFDGTTGTDNYSAFMKAINALAPNLIGTGGGRRVLGRLNIPPGDYYISQTINLYHPIEFVGEGNGSVSRLFFASGIDGFVLNATNTPGGTTNSYSSDGTSFRNIGLIQKAPIVRGNAIVGHVAVKFSDGGISNWGGCGFYMPSTAATSINFKKLWKVMMNVPGANFTSAPTVNLTGDGSGAACTAVLGGRMATATLIDGGDEYYEAPSILVGTSSAGVTESSIETLGYDAKLSCKMGVGKIVITSGGQNYTTATASATGVTGTGFTLGTPVIAGGVITSIPILTQGTDFTARPNIVITGDGTGAAAVSYLKVVSLGIISRGNEYENAPGVSFRGGRRGTGSDASASTTIDTFYVKRINVDARGDNYTFMTATLTGGGGTGAICTPVLFKDILGNSNRCKIKNVNISTCSYGIYTEGSDTNAGLFEAVNISFSRYWAVHEGSFLGNVYDTCICQFNLGAYMMISNTGVNNMLIGCYSEDGEVTSVGVTPANWYGGDHGAGTFGTWKNPTDLPAVTETTGLNSQTSVYGGNPNYGLISACFNSVLKSDDAATTLMDLDTGDTHLHFTDYKLPQYASSTDRVYTLTSPFTLQTFGRTTPTPYAMYIERLRIGGSMAAARALGNLLALPTTGSYAPGDFYFNRTPATADPILGWLRVTAGSNNVDGTDWITVRSAAAGGGATPILAQRSSYQAADYRLVSSSGGSIISNWGTAAILGTVSNGCLNLIERNASGYFNALNIYVDGLSSGLHIGSVATGSGYIAAGGYRVDGTNYKALETVVCSLGIGQSGFLFNVNAAATVGSSSTTVTKLFGINQLGKVVVGSQAATAFLDVAASVAATASFKINPGVAVTSPNDGEMWYSGSHLNFRLGGSTITLDAGANLFNTDLTLPANRNHTINGSNYIRFNVTNVPSGYVSIGDQNNTATYVLNVNGNANVVGTISCTNISPTANINTGGSILSGTTLASTGGFGCNGASPVGKQAAGVNTAAGTYSANEQTMLQAVYNAMRTFGFLT